MKYCASDKILPKTLEKLPKKLRQILLGHIIVNDEYKFLYCFTPKVSIDIHCHLRVSNNI